MSSGQWVVMTLTNVAAAVIPFSIGWALARGGEWPWITWRKRRGRRD